MCELLFFMFVRGVCGNVSVSGYCFFVMSKVLILVLSLPLVPALNISLPLTKGLVLLTK